MPSFYAKADAWIIRRLNDLYLWALDWTGLYVGTVCLLVGVEQTAYLIWRGHAGMALFIFLLDAVCIAGPRYYLQAVGDQKMFNALAEYMENWIIIRTIFILWNIFVIPMHFLQSNYWGVFDDVIGIILWFVFCFRIRDREKKEFKVFKAVPQGST